jgi:hypothetical protein
MRLARLALPLLAACTPFPTPPASVAAAACDAARLSAEFVGRDATVLLATTFAQPIRVIRPGEAVTLDFNPERINVELDAAARIVRVTCG